MARTPFDKVQPMYRSAIPASSHWMNVCHPYFIPNQPPPPPPPCGCGMPPPRPPVPPKPGCGCMGPVLDHAPVPCGAVTARPPRPVVIPAIPREPGMHAPCVPILPPVPVPSAPCNDPISYDGNTSAFHPKYEWLAKREVEVVAGDNVEVTKIVEERTGDKTFIVSSKTDPAAISRIQKLEAELRAQLAEVERIKASMLTVSEDDTEGGEGIVFKEGME